MKIRLISILFFVSLFLGAGTTSFAQPTLTDEPCEIYDPLFEDEPEDDPCCGIVYAAKVCYYLGNIDPTWGVPSSNNPFVFSQLDHPCGKFAGQIPFTSFNQLADSITALCPQNKFTYDPATNTICGDTVGVGYGDLVLLHYCLTCIGIDTEIIHPIITPHPCPIKVPGEAFIDAILNPNGANIANNVVFDGYAGTAYVQDVLNPDSTINDSLYTGPSGNSIAIILNAIIESGAWKYGAGCFNLNCLDLASMADGLNQDTIAEEINNYFDTLPSPPDPGNQSYSSYFSDQVANALSGINLPELLNANLGFSIPNIPCDTTPFSFEGIYGSGTGGPQPAGTPTPDTEAEVDVFSKEIQGLGHDAAPPSPSSMEMIKNVKGGVSLYNGSQSTSIPLYNFQAHDISIPISISSTDNGLKVNDLGSLVGQHWNLDVGGEINRVIKGLPDEFYGTVEGIGRGRNFKLAPRFEFPSNIGLSLSFPGDGKFCGALGDTLVKLKGKLKNGFKFNTTYDMGNGTEVSDAPVTFEIRWKPIQPNLVNLTIGIPVFKFFGLTVYLNIGCSAGVTLNESLGKTPFKEKGLGYLHLSDEQKMAEFGLPTFNPPLINSKPAAIQQLLLEKMQSVKRFDDDKFFSDHVTNWDNWIQTIKNIFTEGFAIKTKKLDTEPDEFHYNCGGYSGTFSLTLQKEAVLFPFYEGLKVEPGFDVNSGDLISFTITTPEGMEYTFGNSPAFSDPNHGIDWTQNTNYHLPNYYTYPEVGQNNTRFQKAQIDMAIMYYNPFFGAKRVRTWGNTYDRNYKVMDAPRYSSTWHLVGIKSLMTGEEASLEYEKRTLDYYSDKSYSHSFPNFDLLGETDLSGNSSFLTTANGNLNTLSLFLNSKWESGRAEFTYSATETNLERWHLVKIIANRGESVQFYYDNGTPRAEIVNDYLLDKILVKRSGLTFKGWKFGYDISTGTPTSSACSPGIPGLPAPPPISMGGEVVFNLGNPYSINWYDYHTYLYFILGIGDCFSLPFQIHFPFIPYRKEYGYRKKMSEFGSLMEIKSFVDDYNKSKETAIYNAEKSRSFLKTIQEIDRDESLHPFITNIGYLGGALPKKFSLDQDLFGYYNDNSASGSPLPKMIYKSIFGNPIFASIHSAKHYGFFNESAPDSMMVGHNEAADEDRAKIGALQSVEFASGAIISYDYELNELPNGTKGAGLRVKQLTEDPHDSPAKVTKYGYQYPTVVNTPIRNYQIADDYYYRGLESRVMTTSSSQNYLFPNKNNHVGYGIVTDTFVGNGWIDHYFTNPFTDDGFLDSIFKTTPGQPASLMRFHLNKKASNCCSSFSGAIIATPVPPQVEFPDFSYQSWLMGVEYANTVFAAGGDIRQKNNYLFSRYGTGSLLYTTSIMYQNNYPGSFWENYFLRLVQQFQPFNGDLLNDWIDLMVDLFLGNIIPHPFKEIDRYHYASDRRLNAANIRPFKSVTEDYLLGGINTATTDYLYHPYEQNARVISSSTTYTGASGFSQQTITNYLYATDNAAEINDFGAKNYLNTFGYNQPLVSKTLLGSTLIKEDYTSLKMDGNKVVPDRNFTLREGVLIVDGIFNSHNGDGMPTSYSSVQFDGNSFPEPMLFDWNDRLQLTSKSYAGFSATKSYGPTYFELQSVTDVNGVGTQFTYDPRWRLATQMALNNRQFTTYAYTIEPGNNTIVSNLTFTDGSALPQPSTLKLDGFGRELSLRRDNDGAILSGKAYDNFFRLAGESYIKSGPVIYIYEPSPLPKWTEEIDGVGNKTRTEAHVSPSFYSASHVIDPNMHLSQTHLDALGLTRQTISGEGSTTNYEYDEYTRPVAIINPIGEPFTFTYNAMDKVIRKKVPGMETEQIFTYDLRYRMETSQDANANLFNYSYDELDRITEVGSSSEPLLRNTWQGGGNWLLHSDERILTEQGLGDYKTTINSLDDIGRVESSTIAYPHGSVLYTNTLNNALQVTTATSYVSLSSGESVNLVYDFSYDDVLRPERTELTCNGASNSLSQMEYNGMDLVSAKYLGAISPLSVDFLQEVNYLYDGAGKLIQINGQEDLKCESTPPVCELIASFTSDTLSGFCPLYLTSVEVNGQHYPVDPGIELYDPNNAQYLGPTIEAALAYFGFGGTVIVNSYEQNGFVYYNVTITNTNASQVALWGPECKFAEFEIGYCCGGGEEAMAGFLSPPATSDDPDLYFEKITYTGWDITNIKYGGDCTWGIMSNDFTYDANHRVTAMNSGVFNPHATGADYSTTYQYDPAGNIRELTRKGLMPDGTTYGLIDDLRYEYDSERLKTVDDLTDNPKGFKPLISNYTYDPNGNITFDDGKGLEIQVNPINLPRRVVKSGIGGGEMKLHYTFGGEKIKQEVTGGGNDDETRLYVGGVEFVTDANGTGAEAYYHGEGRVLLKNGQRRFQYKITDHLGDLAVFFEDKNGDGDIETEEETSDPNVLEVLQRHFYYPFGLNMEGPWAMQDQAKNMYQYNGKELADDLGLDWYFYGARMHDAAIGRFTGVDPLADEAPSWTPYRYGFNSPLIYIDPDGLFETKKAAKQYAKDNNIRTGWFSGSSIRKQEDGTFAITSSKFMGDDAMMVSETFITDMGGDIGIVMGTTIKPGDVVDREDDYFTIEFVKRDGSTMEFDRPSLGFPAGGAAVKGGVTLMGSFGYTFRQLRKALKAAYDILGVKSLPKYKEGKFGSPQRGNSQKGVRLDKEGHPKTTDPSETGPHINWWDYTKGKRGKGGNSGAEKIE